MALDVSGSQVYAGRYHYRRSEMPDLFRGRHGKGESKGLESIHHR